MNETSESKLLRDAILDSLDVIEELTVPSRSMGPVGKLEFIRKTLLAALAAASRVRNAA